MDRITRQKYLKWIRWTDSIYTDIFNLIKDRYIYFELRRIIINNKSLVKDNVLYSYLNNTYGAYILIGIRRQTKVKLNINGSVNSKDNSVSLMRLLLELYDNPNFISTRVNINELKRDIQLLKRLAHNPIKFADRYIAHRDKNILSRALLIKRNEINNCLNKIAHLYNKYCCTFLSGNLHGIYPPNGSYIDAKWKEVFKVPWLAE